MKHTTTAFIVMALLAACAKKDDTPAPATAPAPGTTGYPPAGYAQPNGYAQPTGAAGQVPQGQYAQPQAYPTAAPQTYAPAPAGQPATAAGTMATPGPLALACQNDAACGLAHCNVQYGKCAYPCLGAVDCIQGASCNTMTGLCLPGATP